MDLIERVRTEAMAAGLVAVGVCETVPFAEVKQSLDDAVASGRSAGLTFTFLDSRRSTDISLSLPWATRLVVGAHAYLPAAGSPGPEQPGSARVARFAEADHYLPLRTALKEVAAVLIEAGHRAEVLVDDNRLVDRAAAVRAGVGWWGKSTMVLVPGAGPWVLLGSIATDAPLAVSPPMQRTCGTCTACLPACPTGALVAPGVLDARRCLARWAQAPGWFPVDLRPLMGDRLYGCDDCLEACPPGDRLLDRSRRRAGRIDAVEVLIAGDDELQERFSRFYVPGNEVRYLRRNALIVLGNSGDREVVEPAIRMAHHQDPLLRGHAAWALGMLGGPAAAAVLERLRSDPDPLVAAEAEAARPPVP
jgi:epoxyqueuosine reductase